MSSNTIPRFLLPRASSIWRLEGHAQLAPQFRSYATRSKAQKPTKPTTSQVKPASSKPIVLEQPTKFNPPSHGSRLPKPAPRYPGPQLSAEEIARQSSKKYPNMMPPPGTVLHKFIYSKSIHLWITMGVLSSLAGFTFLTNFRRTSKFADLLPPASDLIWHPIRATKQSFEVLRLHTAAVGAEANIRRQRNIDDIAKRDLYRKAHGKTTDGFGGWSAKANDEAEREAANTERASQLEPIGVGAQQSETRATGVANDADGGLQEHIEHQQQLPKKPLRKWLGIW